MSDLSMLVSFIRKYNDKRFWNAYFTLQNKRVSRIRRALIVLYLYHVQAVNCCDLMIHYSQPGAYFSGKPTLPHGLNGIVISNRAHIGKNAFIHQQVTIGLQHPEGEAPTIGDNVFIGAGARILGGVTIGDGAVIGANAVVIDDVPPCCVVVGVPAKIVKRISNDQV